MTTSALLLIELVVLFFVVTLGVELVQRRVGPARLRAWMGGRPLTAALKGIAIGFVTPFCTYSAVPVLVGMRRAGVPAAGYVAFVVAAPVLDPILFGALVVIVGIEVAVIYLTTAFIAALSLALAAQHIGIDHQLKPVGSNLGGSDPAGQHPDWKGMRIEASAATAHAIALLRSVAVLLVVGVAIGFLIETFVSPERAADITGNNTALSIPIAAALGVPLYVHTEFFVPIADALSGAGIGVGTIVALTIAGAGANVPEFVILSRLASTRLIGILFVYVFLVAIIGGTLAQTLT